MGTAKTSVKGTFSRRFYEKIEKESEYGKSDYAWLQW